MDAPEPKLELSRDARPIVVRLVIAWLAVLIALGAWQGYGQWLLGGAAAYVA